jgi:hypothetical protein
MSFNFSLTNVASAANFKSDDVRKFNSLDAYEDGSKDGLMTYPLDLGTTDKAHFMMFSIFEQEVSKFKGDAGANRYGNKSIDSQGQVDIGTLQSQGLTAGFGQAINDSVKVGGTLVETAVTSGNKYVDGLSQESKSFVEKLKQGIASKTGGFYEEGIKPITDELKRTDVTNFNRKIRRIKETVALYLPDTLVFDYNQGYSDVGMYADKGGLGAVAASAVNQIAGLNSQQKTADMIGRIAGKNLSPFISRALGSVGGAGKVVASTLLGGVENPMLELLYTQPEFRTFRFDYMLYPKSVSESQEVHRIINCFKFHSAPEIKPGSAGFFLVPPSIFNIEFYYNGELNPNLPTITDCVCTSVSVDYAPSGWSAYEVPNPSNKPEIGGNGSPFAVRLSLAFKETIILTKNLYDRPNSSSKIRQNR